MAEPMIEAHDLAKAYGDETIFHDASFTLERGGSMSISSASGSGKSTLLAIVGLILTPDAGTVTIGGKDASVLDEAERARLRQDEIGFVFQHTQLIGSLRAWENVAVPARFAARVDFDVKERARRLLCELGLAERLDHYPYQLSVGQKRRIAVARALLLEPKIVIADEPTNDLDAGTAHSVAAKLFEQVEHGRSLILVTHDQALAAKTDHRYELTNEQLVKLGASL